MRRGAQIALLALPLMLGLTSCGSSSPRSQAVAPASADKDQTAAVASDQKGGDASESAAADTGSAAAPDPSTGSPAVPSAANRRKIVRTGSIRVTTKDVIGAVPRAQAIVEGFGGYVSAQTGSYGGSPAVSMTFRVPATAFDQAMASLSKLGKLEQATIGTDEVTAQAVDLEARIRSTKVGRDRLLELIKTADSNTSLVELERELTQREADIESMQGKLNALNDRVALSTITIAIARTSEDTQAILRDSNPTFSGGLKGGWSATKNLTALGVAIGGALIGLSPMIAIALLTAFVLQRMAKRRRRNRPIPTYTGPGSVGSVPQPSSQTPTPGLMVSSMPPSTTGPIEEGPPLAESTS